MNIILVVHPDRDQLVQIKENLEDVLPGSTVVATHSKEAAVDILLKIKNNRDITEQVNQEQQARQSQKIEAISRLATGIAHDFNNILAIIQGYTELSLVDIPQDSLLYGNLQHVLSATDRAKDLVNQVLTFSHQSEDEREPVKVSRIIDETLRILQASLPSFIEIRRDIEDENGTVLANPTQIRQVSMALCSYVAYAMRETGGIMEVRLKKFQHRHGTPKKFPGIFPGSFLAISIQGTGHAALQEEHFPLEGTTMSLNAIQDIVEKHGGGITVEPEPGKSTTFHIYLPEAKPHHPPYHEPGKAETAKKECILFVDDERMLAYMQQEILEKLGYDVVAVPNGPAALDIFRETPRKYDLVIADQNIPGLNGSLLAGEILKIRPDIPVILCTAFSETSIRQEALKIGVKEFIIKPIIQREIAGVIRKVLKKEKNEFEKEV
jgi:two-component system, cell cycle sensor histidine kinase and response regulator CckA